MTKPTPSPERRQRVLLGSEDPSAPLYGHVAAVLEALGHEVVPIDSIPVDRAALPAVMAVAEAVAAGSANRGVVVATTGHREQVIANRVTGVRATTCHDPHTAWLGRQEADTNVLVLGAAVVTAEIATAVIETWMATRPAAVGPIALAGGGLRPVGATGPKPDFSPFRVRPARPDDAEALVEIVAATAPDLRSEAVKELVPVVRGDRPGRYVVAADETDVPLGTIGWVPDIWGVPDVVWLVWLYLRPERRRTGMADALMTSVLEDCGVEGARKVYLDVGNADTHLPAMRFHERHGFRQEGRLIDFWADGEDLFVFGRRL